MTRLDWRRNLARVVCVAVAVAALTSSLWWRGGLAAPALLVALQITGGEW